MSALDARVTANEGSITNIQSTIHDDEAGLASAVSRIGALETQNGNVDISAVGSSVTDAVDKVNTKAVNANSMANQALTTANAVATTVGDANSGLVKDVADNASDISSLETTVGDASSGLVKDVADNASAITALDNAKQNVLTFDSVPTENSSNPVTSNGIFNTNAIRLPNSEQTDAGMMWTDTSRDSYVLSWWNSLSGSSNGIAQVQVGGPVWTALYAKHSDSVGGMAIFFGYLYHRPVVYKFVNRAITEKYVIG